MDTQNPTPEPDLEARQARAEALKAIALAEQQTAEARMATVVADAATAAAARDQARTSAQAEADLRKTLAESAKAEAEARKAEEDANRALADSDNQARRDRQKADAETRKLAAEADAAAVKAVLPGEAQLKPLEGTVTADSASGALAEALAYQLLVDAVREVVEKAPVDLKGKKVLVVGGTEFAESDWAYTYISARFGQLSSQIEHASSALPPVPQPPTPTPAGHADEGGSSKEVPAGFVATPALLASVASALPSVAGAVADVAGYFQGNYQLIGRVITAKEEPVVAALAAALAAKGATVIVDSLRRIPETGPLVDHYDRVKAAYLGLVARKVHADSLLVALAADKQVADDARTARQHKVDADPANMQLRDDLRTASAEAGRTAAVHRALETAIARAAAALGAVESFWEEVTAPPAAGGLPLLGRALLRQRLREDDGLHIAQASISVIAGETQVRQRRIFAPTVRYIGTCTFAVTVVQPDGEVVFAAARTVSSDVVQKLSARSVTRLRVVNRDPVRRVIGIRGPRGRPGPQGPPGPPGPRALPEPVGG